MMCPEVPFIILILGIPIYFICKWTLRRLRIGKEKNTKLLAIIPTVVLSPLIYIGLIMLWIFSISYYTSAEFNQSKWDSNIEERYTMSKDIIDSQMLIGKGRQEVIQILGNDYKSPHGSSINYILGHLPGLINIDPDYLHVTFESDTVVSVIQLQG